MSDTSKLTVCVPVECQNGHKATWYIEIHGLEVKQIGVPHDESRCDCSKFGFGQGYHATGKAKVID